MRTISLEHQHGLASYYQNFLISHAHIASNITRREKVNLSCLDYVDVHDWGAHHVQCLAEL